MKSVCIRSYSGPYFPASDLMRRGTLRSISPCSVQMWEKTDQNNSEYGHLLRSDSLIVSVLLRNKTKNNFQTRLEVDFTFAKVHVSTKLCDVSDNNFSWSFCCRPSISNIPKVRSKRDAHRFQY